MRAILAGSAVLLLTGLVAGTVVDRPVARPPVVLGGYRVLAADFHVHSATWSDGAMTPFGLVLEAERQGLDAIAITGHLEVADAKVGRWFSERTNGPVVLVGEEIIAPEHHVIAVGIDRVVSVRLPLGAQIDDVHAQGGVAIAAHPIAAMAPGFDLDSRRRLDGAEICHPLIYPDDRKAQGELEAFAASTPLAAIGSSDFHGFMRLGICRTYVFARDRTAAAIIDAIRAHRTVVYGLNGRAYGDPDLIALAATRPELREAATTDPPQGWADRVSAWCAFAGLFGLITATGTISARR